MTDQAPQQLKQKQMPPILQEDIVQLVGVAFAEKFAGFERVESPGGPRWLSSDKTKVSIPMEELPQVVGTQFALLEVMDQFCANANEHAPPGVKLIWGINLRPDGEYSVQLVESWAAEAHPSGKPTNTVIEGTIANDSGFAIAMVLVAQSDANMDQMHRELFPHRYIVTPNG